MSRARLACALAALAVLASLALGACGDSEPSKGSGDTSAADTVADAATNPETDSGPFIDDSDASTCPTELVEDDGITIRTGCGGAAAMKFLPAVKIGGAWRGGGRDGACTAGEGSVTCPAGPGTVTATLTADGLQASWDGAATVEALALEGSGWISGATTWLSNGFQSWSQSGALAIAAPVSQEALRAALDAEGTEENLRKGAELSWWFTWVSGGDLALVAGALTAERWASWVQVSGDGKTLAVRLVCGDAGEAVATTGHLDGEPWFVSMDDTLRSLLTAYGKSIPTRRRTVKPPAEAGWNSWYDLWDSVDEAAVRANAPLAKAMLTPHLPPGAPPLRIVIDDGWQEAWGEWTPNDKFPSGLDGLAADLTADGYEVGVWLAPLLVQEDAPLATAHPDWLVGGAKYKHPVHGTMRILDVTHPDAAAHLRTTAATLAGWGLTLLKIDFLFAGAQRGTRHEDVTPMQAYGRAMQLIREGAGEDVILLAVGSPLHGSAPYVDAWRVGGDIALQPIGPKWPFIANQARTVAARWPLCRATLCDADPVLLRTLPQSEVEAGGWVAAFAGGALFLSDDLRALPAERQGWGIDAARAQAALSGMPSIPIDPISAAPPSSLPDPALDVILSQDSHVVPTVWELPSGERVAFNASALPVDVQGITVPGHSASPLPAQ